MGDEAPRHFPTDRETLERESEISFFVAGGPGGQNRNKVSTGVRLVHRPSGVVVTATERRSQWANREAAFERLAERLRAMSRVEAPRVATRPSRAARDARLEQKRRRALVKQARRRAGEE